jgi:branched-chain amino acid aminotransferase
MEATSGLKITTTTSSKLSSTSLKNIPFGRYFTDHMLEVDYENGEWGAPEIKPYQPLMFEPSLAVFHYGQAIFEGIKAYKTIDGAIQIFRPYDNFQRFNTSALRMQMPEVPAEIFIDGMAALINVDKAWIPDMENHALYIRPFMISTDEAIGVRPSAKYKFLILLSPTGPYYSAPMKIYVEEKYVRAAPGGIGFAKAAGNYGAVMHPSAEAHKKGYDQVLWMDAAEHRYVQECGTMNAFFIIGNTAITPGLEEGTILAGVTRDSVITLLKEAGLSVEERPLSIEEIMAAYQSGELKEIFGTGTAATVALIKELRYKDYQMHFDVDSWKIAPAILSRMDAIKSGEAPDAYNWLHKI